VRGRAYFASKERVMLRFGFKGLVVAVFVMVFVAGTMGVSEGQLVTGDYCWTVRVTQDEEGAVTVPAMTVKFHITVLDPTNVVMAGKVNVAGDDPFTIMGVGTVMGANLVANLTTSQIHGDGWRDTGVMRATIKASDLSGTFYEIGHDFDTASRGFDQRYTSGRLVPRKCP
jgi:hypothetical protein